MMTKIKRILTLTLLPLVCGILLSLENLKTDRPFTDSLITTFCGYIHPKSSYIGLLLRSMSPVLIFTILFGNYVYTDMTKNGVYIMVRYKKRSTFYLKKSAGLIACTLVYSAFFLLGVLTVLSTEGLNRQETTLMLIAFYNFTMMCLMLSLAVNILSVVLGASTGFAFGLSAFALLCVECVTHTVSSFNKFTLSMLNPVRSYIINWHDSRYSDGNEIWKMYMIKGFSFRSSVILYAAAIAVLWVILFVAVQVHDIAVDLKDEV